MFGGIFKYFIAFWCLCNIGVFCVENVFFETTHVFRIGSTATLKCTSNLDEHIFMFWHLPKTHVVIGPRNDFDGIKYDFDAVSGDLKIRGLSEKDAGIYSCVSEGINKQDIKIRNVQLRVIQALGDEDTFLQDSMMIAFAVLLLLLVVILIVYFGISVRQKISGKCKKIDFESGCSNSGIYNPTTAGFTNEKQKLYGNNLKEEKVPEEKQRMYQDPDSLDC